MCDGDRAAIGDEVGGQVGGVARAVKYQRLAGGGDGDASGEDVRYRLASPALLVRNSGLQRSIELRLSASEFLDRIAGLIPPSRKHRHCYFWGSGAQHAVVGAGGGTGWPEAGGG